MSSLRLQRSVHRIDGEDVIRFVDDAWVAFAAANGAPELAPRHVIGHCLYDFIAGEDTRRVYRLLLGRVRSRRLCLRVPFRCDSPEKKRSMTLHVRPYTSTGVEFVSELMHEETRACVALLDSSAPRSDDIICVCSWCKRVLVGQRWEEIESAIANLQLMQSQAFPQLTHGMCPECFAIVQRVHH